MDISSSTSYFSLFNVFTYILLVFITNKEEKGKNGITFPWGDLIFILLFQYFFLVWEGGFKDTLLWIIRSTLNARGHLFFESEEGQL